MFPKIEVVLTFQKLLYTEDDVKLPVFFSYFDVC